MSRDLDISDNFWEPPPYAVKFADLPAIAEVFGAISILIGYKFELQINSSTKVTALLKDITTEHNVHMFDEIIDSIDFLREHAFSIVADGGIKSVSVKYDLPKQAHKYQVDVDYVIDQLGSALSIEFVYKNGTSTISRDGQHLGPSGINSKITNIIVTYPGYMEAIEAV